MRWTSKWTARLGVVTFGALVGVIASPAPRAEAAIPPTLEQVGIELVSMTIDGADQPVTATTATLVAGYTLRLEGKAMSEQYDDGQ